MGRVRFAAIAEPTLGDAVEVAEGVYWVRLPLEGALDHVNAYLLRDDAGWTLIDAGANSGACRDAFAGLLARAPFAGASVTRVVVTHHHPDHLGLAAEFAARGAQVWCTEECWGQAQALRPELPDAPTPAQVLMARRCGVSGVRLAAFERNPCRRLPMPYPPPVGSHRPILDGETLELGGRRWRVLVGGGHAAGHATLWSDDGLAFTGDQVLAGVAANLSVPATQPDLDPVSVWVASCRRIAEVADDNAVCLAGHQAPFIGAVTRCRQTVTALESALNRLLDHLDRPATALDCLPMVYRRPLQPHEANTLLAECVGYLNHLMRRGLVRRDLTVNGAYLYRRTAEGSRGLRVRFDDPAREPARPPWGSPRANVQNAAAQEETDAP